MKYFISQSILLGSVVALSLRIGTRSSNLAQIQARQFQAVLKQNYPDIKSEIVPIDASGDKSDTNNGKLITQQLPLAIGGVDFTSALDIALADGIVDVVVHSLKDIPPASRWEINADAPRITIGAYLCPRENPQDVLVSKRYKSIEDLPMGGKVGSSSMRRQAQLLANRPDLNIINIRGNVDARLMALNRGELDGLILALAGLNRLGMCLEDEKTYQCYPIPVEILLPCVGQGIVAITCRINDKNILSLLKRVNHYESGIAAVTERAFLDSVDHLSPWKGRPPVAGLMSQPRSGEEFWQFRGLLATPDGRKVLTVTDKLHNNSCSEASASKLGRMAAADLLENAGDNFLDGYYSV